MLYLNGLFLVSITANSWLYCCDSLTHCNWNHQNTITPVMLFTTDCQPTSGKQRRQINMWIPVWSYRLESTTFVHTHTHTHILADKWLSDTHTHTRLMAHCTELRRRADTRKVKPIWILLKQESEWQWHRLSHMHVCTSLQTDNHASTTQRSQAGCPSCRPTNSVKAVKAWWMSFKCISMRLWSVMHIISVWHTCSMSRQLIDAIWFWKWTLISASATMQPSLESQC